MRFKVRDVDIATGAARIVIINKEDAARHDLHHGDRLLIRKGARKTTAVLDIAESVRVIPRGFIGCMEEVLDALNARGNDVVEVLPQPKPESVAYIRKKMDGGELSRAETVSIIRDISEHKLTDIEIAAYVSSNYVRGMSMRETVDLTNAMKLTGEVLNVGRHTVADVHCIGGVPGNRTTLIIVPILVAAGLTVPKTSSRAITSPAGTADTMEVLAPVSLSAERLKRIIRDVGGFIVWGGAINLAPADDRIINVEHPLGIDAEGQMLASIMAKKASVNATHLLLDIPVGPGSKVRDSRRALRLQRKFAALGRRLGIKVVTMVTDGSEPIGNGIGPALEARDCLWVLMNDVRGPRDLRQKSIEMSAALLEMCGKAPSGKGVELASRILDSGLAFSAMKRIIRAQGGQIVDPLRIKVGSFKRDYHAPRSGKVLRIDNVAITRIAHLAGAPKDAGAGLFLHKHVGDSVRKGAVLFTIYAMNSAELGYAWEAARVHDGVVVG